MNTDTGLLLTPAMVPNEANFDVRTSSFFTQWDRLPSPQEIRTHAIAQHAAGNNPDTGKIYSVCAPYTKPPPAVFVDQSLFVKWGTRVKADEARCLYAIKKLLEASVPVPEVYGWRTDGEEVFIYMELKRGKTLEQIWDSMDLQERLAISLELRRICEALRKLKQDPQDPFIGTVSRSALYDRTFASAYMTEAGPFPSVATFHDWFTFLPRRWMADPYEVPIEPFRYELSDESDIKFTHSDLHPSNIVLTSSPPFHVLAIIDWEQSGWLPSYWEVRKAQWTGNKSEGWSSNYLPMILDESDSTLDPWMYYTSSMF